jgi:hypothetical protein
MYNYNRSLNDTYILRRDGKDVLIGKEIEVWGYLHKTHSYSIDWAIKNEGYSIVPQVANK